MENQLAQRCAYETEGGGKGAGQEKAGEECFSSRWLSLQAAEGNRLGCGWEPPFRIRRWKVVIGEVDGQREGRQKNGMETGEHVGIKAQGCSSEGPSPVIPAWGINCLVEWDVVSPPEGAPGVNEKGTRSGCVVRVWWLNGKGSGVELPGSLICVSLTRPLHLSPYM